MEKKYLAGLQIASILVLFSCGKKAADTVGKNSSQEGSNTQTDTNESLQSAGDGSSESNQLKRENEELKEKLSVLLGTDMAKIQKFFKEGSYVRDVLNTNIVLRGELEKTSLRYLHVEEKYQQYEFTIQNYRDKISHLEKEISTKDKRISSLGEDYLDSCDKLNKEYDQVSRLEKKISELEEQLRLEKNKK